MNRTIVAAAILGSLASAPVTAGPLEDEVALLKKEVQQLQQQVATLRATLARDALGNVTVKAIGNRVDQVGAQMTATIGAGSTTSIGADAMLTVGGSSGTSVNGNVSHQVGGNLGVAVARSLQAEAGDQILLKVGAASILMKKSGEITIEGSLINVKGSADVVIKGSKVLAN